MLSDNLGYVTSAHTACADVLHVDCRQLGLVEFEPLQSYFIELYTGTQAVLPVLPGTPSAALFLDRGWDPEEGKQVPQAPALVSHPAVDMLSSCSCCSFKCTSAHRLRCAGLMIM